MAILLRRTLILSRYLLYASQPFSIHSRHFSPSFMYFLPNFSHQSSIIFNSQTTILHHFDTCRSFSRGRKQQIKEKLEHDVDIGVGDGDGDEDGDGDRVGDDDNSVEGGDVASNIKAVAVKQMETAVDALSRELTKLRTGRASEGILDHIMVEYYGVKTALNRMAAVSVSDPKTLRVTPYDPSALKELEKAIISSPLGLNPKADNQQLIIPIPPLTKDHMQAVCKVVARTSEDVKQSIRRSRQKALDDIRKLVPKRKDKDKDKATSSMTEDDVKRFEKEIDDLTKRFIKRAEDMCKSKEKDICG